MSASLRQIAHRLSDFAVHIGCIEVGHRLAKAREELGKYLPVRPTLAKRLNGWLEGLYASLDIGEGPFLLDKGASGQENIGVTGCFGEEEILHNKEADLVQRGIGLGCVREVFRRVAAHHVERLHLASESRIEDPLG